MVRDIDLVSLAHDCYRFESHQGFWILSCEEAIQIAYEMLVVLLRCLLVPEIIRRGLPPPLKAEKLPYDFNSVYVS